MSKIRGLLIVATALALTGCATTATTTASEPAETRPANCLTPNDAAIEALTTGIIDEEVELTGYAAVPAPSGEELWYVGATYTSPSIDGTAVWITQYDPTSSPSNAYLSIDAVAEAISDYHRLESGTAAAPGAVEVTACLK